MPLDARSLGLEGRLQDRRRGRGGGLCLQVGARAGSPLCSSRSGLDSPFPWPSRLPSCPLPPAHLPTPRPLPALAFLPFQPQSPFPCGSPRLELGPSGHPHLQTGANWGEGAGEREGAVGGKGSPITAPTLRTPVRGCGCHFQAGGGGPSRAHAWETSGGGARAPAQRGQRGPVCVCVCARARWGAGWALSGARRLQPTSGSLSSPRGLCLKTQIRHCGGARPALEREPETTGPAPRPVHVPAPCGALDAPGPTCRAPETRASGTISPRKCPASTDCPAGAVVPRPLHCHHGQMRSVSPTSGADWSRPGRRPGPRP